MTNERKSRFPNSKLALEVYDKREVEINALWKKADCNADVERALEADEVALRELQKAFYEDTKHINSESACRCILPSDIRRLVQSDNKADG